MHALQPRLVVRFGDPILALGVKAIECTACEGVANGKKALTWFGRKYSGGKNVLRGHVVIHTSQNTPFCFERTTITNVTIVTTAALSAERNMEGDRDLLGTMKHTPDKYVIRVSVANCSTQRRRCGAVIATGAGPNLASKVDILLY
jgi:hypothetical protein